jgi:inorganic pyrophosphatase
MSKTHFSAPSRSAFGLLAAAFGLSLALSACQPRQETPAGTGAAAVTAPVEVDARANDTTRATAVADRATASAATAQASAGGTDAAPPASDSTAPDSTAATAAPAAAGDATDASAAEPTNVAEGVMRLDAMTLVGPKGFLEGYEPVNSDGTVNAVVEIPAGTTAKWEVKSEDGNLHWDVKDDKPRLVEYLGYPVNYGMVPQTQLAESMGGDGDPVDILLLGDALPRGTVVPVRIIGIAKFTDTGERDDKLIVVRDDTPFAEIQDLVELQASFPGVTNIIATWFLNYKGPGVFQFQGYGGPEEAKAFLDASIEAFANPEPAEEEAEDEAEDEATDEESAEEEESAAEATVNTPAAP